tara:strand:+ start:771 stop:1412 length:642 start_codon:yes stop_codon:yes gene_type:complete
MLKISKDNYYFIPNHNKNGLHLYSVENLFEDDFEIMVKFKVDWDSYEEKSPVGGVIAKNGKHMGIFTKKDWDGESRVYTIVAKLWTEHNGNETLKELSFIVPDELYECVLTHDLKNKKFTFKCNEESKEYIYEGKISDYKENMFWYGCGMGFGEEWNEHFYGTLYESYVSIRGGFKVFESDFKKCTQYKVFDKSWNGNHLVKFDQTGFTEWQN